MSSCVMDLLSPRCVCVCVRQSGQTWEYLHVVKLVFWCLVHVRVPDINRFSFSYSIILI